jgi:DNA-binding transcriptional MocR family regulator
MHAALLTPRVRGDRGLAERVAAAGVPALPLSRYAIGRPRWRGLLLGYAALDEPTIEDGVARLAKVL